MSVIDCLGDAGYLKAKSASPSETVLASPTPATKPAASQPVAAQDPAPSAPAEPTVPVALAAPAKDLAVVELAEFPFPDRGEFLLSHFNTPGEFYLQNEDCIVAAVKLQTVVDTQVEKAQSFAESASKPEPGMVFEGISSNKRRRRKHFVYYP